MHEITSIDPIKPLKYRPDIDGLRAVAIISVVCYHAGISWIKGGFVGVDIFFVISGYLIGSLVYKEIFSGTFRISRFYKRRAKRILPALFGVLIFCYIATLPLLSPTEMIGFAKQALATIVSTSNVMFWRSTDYFSHSVDQNLLLMTWSLGVEEQFYVVFPLLMLLMRKAPVRIQLFVIGALAVASLGASIWGTSHYPWATFYLLPTRAWELAVGVLFAVYEVSGPEGKREIPARLTSFLSIVGLGLILFAIGYLDSTMPFPGWRAMFPVCGTLLIIIGRNGTVHRLLSWKPIVFIGLVSYSWYLWHWPLLSFAHIISDTSISVPVGAAIGTISFGCAVLSYRFIERPFRQSVSPTPLLLMRYAAVAVLMTLPPAAMFWTRGLPQRNWRAEQIDSSVNRPVLQDDCLAPLRESHLHLSPECGASGQGDRVALIGDSHASAIGGALHDIAAHSGYGLVLLNRAGCPPLLGITHYTGSRAVDRTDDEGCAQYNRERLDYVRNTPSIRVVVLVAFWSRAFSNEDQGWRYVVEGQNGAKVSITESRNNLDQGLENTILLMERCGKSVYVIQDNPILTFDPVRHMLAQAIPLRQSLARVISPRTLRNAEGLAAPDSTPQEVAASLIIRQVVARHPNVRLYDPHSGLCDESRCRFSSGNQSLYSDNEHLTTTGGIKALDTLLLR